MQQYQSTATTSCVPGTTRDGASLEIPPPISALSDAEGRPLNSRSQSARIGDLTPELGDLAENMEQAFLSAVPRQEESETPHNSAANTDSSSNVSPTGTASAQPNNIVEEPRIRITASIVIQSCPKFCKCKCHTPSHVRTPQLLRNVLGQLLFSYTTLIRSKPCDYPRCRKSARKSHFTYYFPQWMASRALMISSIGSHLTGLGTDWLVRMPVVVPETHPAWTAALLGDIDFLQKCFWDGIATPRMITPSGSNLLHVSSLQLYVC